MSIPHVLVVISACISLYGGLRYVKDTYSGRTKPNRISWFMWALAPLVGTAAAFSAHADPWATTRIFLAGFIPLIVLTASFANKNSYWKLTFFDALCGLCSVIAFFVWIGANSPTHAILLAAIGDGFAALPTILKAWKYPETETGLTYITSLIAVVLVLPSIPVWNIQNSAFQVYLIAVNCLLITAVYRKRVISY